MKTLISAAFLTAACFQAQSQFLKTTDNVTVREQKYISVDGSPYLFKEWKEGTVSNKSGTVTSDLMIRYDSYRDELQFLQNGKTLVISPRDAPEFTFKDVDNAGGNVERFRFRNGFDIPGYTPLDYFNILHDGKSAKFLRKIKTNYIEETVKNYGTNEQVKKFVRKTEDFLIIGSETIVLSKSRKEAVKNFGSYSDKVEASSKQRN
jgi:hypothetical protein